MIHDATPIFIQNVSTAFAPNEQGRANEAVFSGQGLAYPAHLTFEDGQIEFPPQIPLGFPFQIFQQKLTHPPIGHGRFQSAVRLGSAF